MAASIITHSKIKRILFLCFASMMLLGVNSGWADELVIRNPCNNQKVTISNWFCTPHNQTIAAGKRRTFNVKSDCELFPFKVLGEWGDVVTVCHANKRKSTVLCATRITFFGTNFCQCKQIQGETCFGGHLG